MDITENKLNLVNEFFDKNDVPKYDRYLLLGDKGYNMVKAMPSLYGCNEVNGKLYFRGIPIHKIKC